MQEIINVCHVLSNYRKSVVYFSRHCHHRRSIIVYRRWQWNDSVSSQIIFTFHRSKYKLSFKNSVKNSISRNQCDKLNIKLEYTKGKKMIYFQLILKLSNDERVICICASCKQELCMYIIVCTWTWIWFSRVSRKQCFIFIRDKRWFSILFNCI